VEAGSVVFIYGAIRTGKVAFCVSTDSLEACGKSLACAALQQAEASYESNQLSLQK
jgi:hypothetical protein